VGKFEKFSGNFEVKSHVMMGKLILVVSSSRMNESGDEFKLIFHDFFAQKNAFSAGVLFW
jgi:peptidyl-tRNA hydrolase